MEAFFFEPNSLWRQIGRNRKDFSRKAKLLLKDGRLAEISAWLPNCRHYRKSYSQLSRWKTMVTTLAFDVPTSVSMLRLSNCDGLDKVELFVAELRAIERWDADYWRDARPQIYEALAYSSRRERCAEILSELLTLIPRLGDHDHHLCDLKKPSVRALQDPIVAKAG